MASSSTALNETQEEDLVRFLMHILVYIVFSFLSI